MPLISSSKINARCFLMGILSILFFIGLIVPNNSLAQKESNDNFQIKQGLGMLRISAESIKAEEGSYENFNCGNERIKDICNDIEKFSGDKPIIHTAKDFFCVYVKSYDAQSYYCQDNRGVVTETYIDPGEQNYCTGETFVCQRDEDESSLSWIIWTIILIIIFFVALGLRKAKKQ